MRARNVAPFSSGRGRRSRRRGGSPSHVDRADRLVPRPHAKRGTSGQPRLPTWGEANYPPAVAATAEGEAS